MALIERVQSDGAIPPGRKFSLVMHLIIPGAYISEICITAIHVIHKGSVLCTLSAVHICCAKRGLCVHTRTLGGTCMVVMQVS
jgi:hypothetical protein